MSPAWRHFAPFVQAKENDGPGVNIHTCSFDLRLPSHVTIITMPGKRKRIEPPTQESISIGWSIHIYERYQVCQLTKIAITNVATKPMSAIAAARLKAAAPVPNTDNNQELPTSPLEESSASDAAEPELEDVAVVHQNLKLGTWRQNPHQVLSDTANELTIALDKHSTASFVGCFDVRILKGAVNINGANLGAPSKGSKDDGKSHRVYVPSTHPITKIRGLDRTNHIQLRSCPESPPFMDINPLFCDIWSGKSERGKGRSFINVCSHRINFYDFLVNP